MAGLSKVSFTELDRGVWICGSMCVVGCSDDRSKDLGLSQVYRIARSSLLSQNTEASLACPMEPSHRV